MIPLRFDCSKYKGLHSGGLPLEWGMGNPCSVACMILKVMLMAYPYAGIGLNVQSGASPSTTVRSKYDPRSLRGHRQSKIPDLRILIFSKKLQVQNFRT